MADAGAIHLAIDAILIASPATYPVYDGVIVGAALPYVVYDNPTGVPDDELATATEMLTQTISGFARTRAGCQAIRAWLKTKLDHQPVAGVWACWEEFWTIEVDLSTGDERLYHLVSRYRLRTN